MSGHLDGPRPPKLPGPPDPPYIEGDLGSPSREEFDIQRGAANADVPLSDDTAKRLTSAGRHHRRWREQRDELIRIAYQEGAGPREISRLVGLSHPAVISIIRQQPPLFGRSTEDPDVEPTS